MNVNFTLSDDAIDLLKKIKTEGAAEYRDTEFKNILQFRESDLFQKGIRTDDWYLKRNTDGTLYLIDELFALNLIDNDWMAWHTTYVLTEQGKKLLHDIENTKPVGEVISTETENYYECPRCEINSLTEGRMCPCPRGGCEAVIAGTITKTITLDRTIDEDQAKWNKDNYR